MRNQKGYVTPLIILLIVLPIIGFYLGTQYQKISPNTNDSTIVDESNKQLSATNSNYDDKIRDLESLTNFSSYTKNSVSISFNCFDQKSIPITNQVNQIQKDLQIGKRVIYSLCKNNFKDDYIVVHQLEGSQLSSLATNLGVSRYRFYDKDNFSLDFLLQPNEAAKDLDTFKLVDWLKNDDVIFSIIKWQPSQARTFVKTNNSQDSQLIEYCEWGIGGGTSQRSFSFCKSINSNNKSTYLNTEDLP